MRHRYQYQYHYRVTGIRDFLRSSPTNRRSYIGIGQRQGNMVQEQFDPEEVKEYLARIHYHIYVYIYIFFFQHTELRTFGNRTQSIELGDRMNRTLSSTI